MSVITDDISSSLENIKNILSDSSLFEAELEREKERFCGDILCKPHPDLKAYYTALYDGFISYPERLKNYISAKKSGRGEHLPYYPYIFDIEPNTKCTLSCVMCHVSEWGGKGRCADMKKEDLFGFVDNYPYLTEVKLHGMGEPLLHPDYIEMVEYLAARKIWVRTSTNATLFHRGNLGERLIDSGIGEVQISIDGATKEVYEKIRRGGNFELLKNNARRVNRYANKIRGRLITRMWVVLQKNNIGQIFDFVSLARELEFRRLSFSLSLADWARDDWFEKNEKISLKEPLGGDVKEKLKKLGTSFGVDVTLWDQGSSYGRENICPWIFARPYISADMKIVPCCMIANPDIVNFGSAYDLVNNWNNDMYKKFRKMHLSGEIPRTCKFCYA